MDKILRNPLDFSRHEITMSKYLPRTIEPVVKKASQVFKVVMVSGMRQVSKTALLSHLASDERCYVTSDN